METKRQSLIRQIENHLVAQAMMIEIPAKHIVKDLWTWVLRRKANGVIISDPTPHELGQFQCGSAACFGGWCAIHPHFIKQGVKRAEDGAPYHNGEGSASKRLFGAMLFSARQDHECGSDKSVILKRLKASLYERCEELRVLEELEAA